MKTAAMLLVALAVLLTGRPVHAQKLKTHNVYLPSPITVNGAQLERGAYQLTMVPSGARVRLEFWKGETFFAAATGSWVSGGRKYPEDALLLRLNADGSRSLIEVRIAGTNKSVAVANNAGVRISAKRSPF